MTPRPSRLDSLRNLQRQIEQEIERELKFLERAKRLSGDARAVITTRMDFSERTINLTAYHMGVTVADIKGNSRFRDVSQARHVAGWLLRESGHTLMEVGALLGGKDHTTVMHGCKRVEADEELMAHALVIRSALLGEDEAA